jgi:hypothetical protein
MKHEGQAPKFRAPALGKRCASALYFPSKLRSYRIVTQASSSVIAVPISGTIPVPALPFLITQNISPSVRFLWNFGFVKFRGDVNDQDQLPGRLE